MRTDGLSARCPGAGIFFLLLLFLGTLVVPGARAQEAGAVVGRVVDRAGAGVEGASVTVTPAAGSGRRVARTDAGGAYRVGGLTPGRWRVRVARVGYDPAEREVVVAAGGEARADFTLASSGVLLEEVTVEGRRPAERERTRFETEAGVTTRVIGGAELKTLPGLAEADVLRAVEVLPGVVSTSDFSSAFNVRGGSADQNLILLDGFPVFNPFHLGGLFSVFNSDVIAQAELLSGGFGAEYGGRVSSVLNVETRQGDEEPGLHGSAGVSLLATRVALHSALPAGAGRILGGEGGSWFVSGRRSYFDVLLAPVSAFPYHLTDAQGALTLGTRGGGRLRLIGYTGRDVLDLSDFDPPGDEDASSILKLQWNWGNDVVGARWQGPLGAWAGDVRLGWSRFREELGFVEFDDTRFASRVAEGALRADFARSVGGALTLKTGGELSRVSYGNEGRSGGTTFFATDDVGVLSAGYGQLRWQPSTSWIVEPGVRAEVWRSRGDTRTVLSPRLSAKRFFGRERDGAVKLSVGRYAQYLHSLRDENLPVSNDTWVTAGQAIPQVISDQAQLGVERYWGEEWYASVEGYWRRFRGVTDFNPADDPNDPDDDLLAGEGRSYGLDLLLRRERGRLTGWTTVSLLRARRSFPDPLVPSATGEGAETITFAPIFDRTVDVDVVLRYELPRGVDAGLRWNFGTGTPYTRPVGQFALWESELFGGGYRQPQPDTDDEDPEPPLYVVPGDRNRERYPAYHRLDMTVRKTFTRRWGTLTPYLQVLNAYNQRNVLFYFYDYSGTPPTRSGISMFPVLPAIGAEVTF